MHVSTKNSPFAQLKTLDLNRVSLLDGFWSGKQRVNHQISLRYAHKNLLTSGNINNLKLANGTGEGVYNEPVFMDSDIYKWLEAASYSLITFPDPELEAMADETIDLLATAQQEDGYLNSYIQVVAPEKKWKEFAMVHELYCAGHLIEAAVAHHRATGKTSLIDIACRFAVHIESEFGPGKKDAIPGHPEIELALVELARETGERRYLDLARFFIDQRGHGKLIGKTWFDSSYHQDRVPVREAEIVEGHAVRQLYLLAGAADVVLETGDKELLVAIERLWLDMTIHKMYITAGLGARHRGEAFGDAYELPNDTCYCETCAAVANMMWNWRMLAITGEARYADLMERSLYNGFLSGISLSGQQYFYINPLLSRGGIERQEWFGCACCPPNVMRQIAMLGHYVATTNDDGIQIHLYTPVEISVGLAQDRPVKIHMETEYPWNGLVDLTIKATDGSPWELAMRIPGWCQQASLKIGDEVLDVSKDRGTYTRITRPWQPNQTVQLSLEMAPRFTEANPRVDALQNQLAIELGPLVYCLEARDQPENINFWDIRIDPDIPPETAWHENLLDGIMAIHAQGSLVDLSSWKDTLYRSRKAEDLPKKALSIMAVPYYAWANRGAGAMRVWIPQS